MRSLFGKMLAIYVAVIVISFIALITILSSTFEEYFMSQKEKMLIEQCEKIQQQYVKVYERGSLFIDKERLKLEMEALDRYLNARIWWVNRLGEIYIDSEIDDASWLGEKLTYEEVEEVFKGYVIKRKGRFKNHFEESVLTIGYPIIVDNKVEIALFMHVPIPEIKRTISDVYRITMAALIFSILVAFIGVFFLSRNLKKDIKNLNDAVKFISKGNFDKKLNITRNDELGELAQNFNNMAEDLSNLEELRRTFVSNLSHDIRSPLTSIKGFLQAILDGTIPKEKQNKYIKIALNESERLTKMTNDILDLSKMESGEINLSKTEFNINNLLINEIDKFETRLIEKNIDVELELSGGNDIVYADKEQITRVIYNLIDNAVKFVENQGKIGIETKSKKNRIYVSVKNTGTIIPKEELRHIWNRFRKVDKSRGEDKGGSGLGLSIVKTIISNHGENTEVRSSEDEGTVFTFTLSRK
ncbi:ATP-binding protein [Wukongibacter sp. M2B1]|uniref:sensor histidine kinase n=1 Tax=Wukongibacter sp. M2B1 TaxID=3088895 RepID=UPI003D7A57FF